MPKQQSFVGRAKERVQESMDNAREKLEDAKDSTEEYIKQNPFKSVLIALGVGAIVGAGISLGASSIVSSRRKHHHFWNKYNPFR
jgi:ElaB/YqjD/DUF883 family membrane-anchored ribosome-binding protein